jgi:hypothetical protein
MAASKSVKLKRGFTKLNKPTGETIPSGLVLQDTTGNDWYIWVDDDGDLRITDAETAEAASPFNFESGGTSVGGQT